MKTCKSCKKLLTESFFGKHPETYDGLKSACKRCLTKESNRYKKTKKGLPARMFNNQKVNSKRRGMPAPNYSIKEFRDWLNSQPLFDELYKNWSESGFSRVLAPSCDRIDDALPYSLDNITLMTWKENKAKGHLMVRNKELYNPTLLNGGHCAVEKWTEDKKTLLKTYISQSEAVRDNKGVQQANISRVCKGQLNKTGGFHWKYAGSTTE